MAKERDGFSGTQIRIVDRRPFQAKGEPYSDTRDVYMIRDNETVMSGADVTMTTVRSLYLWAKSLGIRVVYDHGTSDPAKRLPSGLDGIP